MTASFALRPLAVADADAMVHVLADPALYEHTGGEPPSLDALRRKYEVQARGHSADGSETWWNLLVLLDGEPIGFVQATIPRSGGPAEIAWVIGRSWQGAGHATRAARMLVDRLAEHGVADVIADIHPDHDASGAVATRIGMRPTGTMVDGERRWVGTTRPSP